MRQIAARRGLPHFSRDWCLTRIQVSTRRGTIVFLTILMRQKENVIFFRLFIRIIYLNASPGFIPICLHQVLFPPTKQLHYTRHQKMRTSTSPPPSPSHRWFYHFSFFPLFGNLYFLPISMVEFTLFFCKWWGNNNRPGVSAFSNI